MRLLIFLYNILTFIPGIAYIVYKSFKNLESLYGLRERLGFYRLKKETGKRVWIHCASVGEVSLIEPLLFFFKERFSPSRIVITTMTESGRNTARKKYKDIDNIFLAPLDLWFIVRNAVERLNPGMMILVETELWPNLLYYAAEKKTRLILINGRLSQRAYQWYRLCGYFFGRLLNRFKAIVVQSNEDAERFSSLKGSSDNIHVAGSMKFDINLLNSAEEIDGYLKKILEGQKVLVAGSTHSGEEETIMDVFCDLKRIIPELKLIIAPRHIERVFEIEAIIKQEEMRYTRRSILNTGDRQFFDVILLDTIGELNALYPLASVVFVGGTLVPVGGHNVIEPAAQGKPVLFGPNFMNFKEACNMLIENEGGICVKDRMELYNASLLLLQNEPLRMRMGENARKTILEGAGSTRRTLEIIEKHI